MTPENLAAKRRAQALCEADRAAWLAEQPFLAHLALQLDIVAVVDPRLATAATDGRSVFVSAPFMLQLPEAERRFVLAHEVWHCALSHLPRRAGRKRRRWNLAADHEVNALLQEQGMMPPDGSVLFPHLVGQAAETVYECLPPQQDDPGPWAGLHDLDQLRSFPDGDPDFRPVADGFAPWPERLRTAVQAGGVLGGVAPRGAALVAERQGRATLPWPAVLSRFLASRCAEGRSWSRPSRRSAALGLPLPGRPRGLPRIAVALDASGSCVSVLPRFLAELRGAVAAAGGESIRLLVFDVAVQVDREIGLAELENSGAPHLAGGGGTSFRPVLEHLAPEAGMLDGMVVLTDGFGRAPAEPPRYPVLWVLTAHGKKPAAWAHCVWLPEAPEPSGRGLKAARIGRRRPAALRAGGMQQGSPT